MSVLVPSLTIPLERSLRSVELVQMHGRKDVGVYNVSFTRKMN